ncbi:MAG: type II secretion system protein GspD [Alphaproteobacteria bacterium]|nr:MAG: type II secretion system protein GspD [Alphaproteobacteria bacterium]
MRFEVGGGRQLAALMLSALLALTACERPPPPVLAPLDAPGALQPAAPRVNSALGEDRARLPVFESRAVGKALAVPLPVSSGSGQDGDVTLTFVDTDIREIVRVILGATLKLNYTIDPSVQGTATLEVARPLPRSALLPTLETLLNQNGSTLSYRDGIYRVMALGPGATTNIAVGPAAVGSGAQVVPLRYAAAKDLVKVLEPYVSEGGKITADQGRNALIVSGDPAVRQTLTGLISAFDIDALAGQSYALFPAGDKAPDRLAAELEKVLRIDNDGPLSGIVRVVPMSRVNAVLVVSAQPRYIDEARRFLGLERRVEEATARGWHVYYVQNGQSADLENLLQRAFTPRNVSAGTRGGSAGAEPGAPGAPGSTAGAAGANPAGEALSSAPSDTGGGEAEDHIRILANRRNNALLIYATPNEYSIIEKMLRKIDIIPLQVMIEATIAEVTLNDNLNYGTQFYLGHTLAGVLSGPSAPGVIPTTGAISTVAGIPPLLSATFPGFVLANGIREVINLLSSVTQVKVLSAPQVMVLDNESARLQVGEQVPVLTQSQQSTISANAPIVNSVDYRDTGVIMVVTPRVNSGGLVSLDISQEVSNVATTITGNINSPTFNQRLLRTRVAVQDGQTVGMAGLIRDNDAQGNSGIPVLKDIPLLGSLVSSQSNARERTELLVLITPRVVRDQRDARALTEDLRNQLINAGLVRQELQRKPLHGSPNPNRL